MIRRREFLLVVVACLGGIRIRTVHAQARDVRRIGVLSPGPTLQRRQYQDVWRPLQDLGWREGDNLQFERRWAEGKPARLEPLAKELVALGVDLIATIGTDATVAARNATSAIPIIMLSAADPVGAGLVASLGHPGGNSDRHFHGRSGAGSEAARTPTRNCAERPAGGHPR